MDTKNESIPRDMATMLKAEKERNRSDSTKVDKISQIQVNKIFLGITFPSQALFPSFIIFSFSHCCVLWKLFPRFILFLLFCKSKEIMNNPNNLLSFFALHRTAQKGENILQVFPGFSGRRKIYFHCFLNFKGI